MKKVTMFVVSFICLNVLVGVANAQSLWNGATSSPYEEPVQNTIKKHDLVQILILEKSSGTSKADLKTDKRSRWEYNINDFLRFETGGKAILPTIVQGQPGDNKINVDARFRQDNTGGTTRQFALTDTITAEVIDVLPNGTLIIEAKKSRKVNNETETIKLTGKIDQKSVTDSKVLSSNIADLNITYEGDGSVNDTQKPGVIGWLLGQLWPF
ncbi:MAG: hypothetical protein A2W23_08290 [Planctomycetes bacterium RBG_16_43_13]|nr:MAG: hypothetical protein A2W23_08290 [Planctomycetes bacterium RBG_16_43_13]